MSALLLAVGCGSKKATISGKVTFKDRPVPGGQVSLLTAKGQVFTGNIDDEGNYTVAKVPLGPVKVGVVPREAPRINMGGRGIPKDRKINFLPPGKEMREEERKAREAALKPGTQGIKNFPDKYKDPEESGLTFTVETGDQTHNIPLDPVKK